MSLTPEEQAELDALIAEGNAAKGKAEDPNTPSPLEQHMDEIDPEGAGEMPMTAEKPASEPDSKPGFLERLKQSMRGGSPAPLSPEQEAAKAALPQVPVGAQDRVGFDALTRGWGDKGIAALTGSTVEEERAKTQAATMEAGDSAGQFKFAGEIAPYMLLPGGLAGGIIRSAAMGAGLAVGDKVANAEGHEDRLPDGEEMIVSGVFGMGGGALGNVIGKGMNGLWNKATHGREELPAFVRRAVTRQMQRTDDAGKAMDASGVKISKTYLTKLSDRIEKNLLQSGIKPDATPQAWMALQRVKAGLETGQDLTIRQVNELRRGVQEIKAKRYETKYIRDIGKIMNDSMENLPTAAKGVVKTGNVQQGIEGWRVMNTQYQNQLKLDAMAEKLAIASAKAKLGKITFDKAMQDEFSKWATSKGGRKEFENLFTKQEQRLLRPLMQGSMTTQISNRVDRTIAGGMFGPTIRALRAFTSRVPAGHEAGQTFGKAFGKLPGGITPAAPAEMMRQGPTGLAAGVGNNIVAPPEENKY